MTNKQIEKKLKELEKRIEKLEDRGEEEVEKESPEWIICIKDTKGKPGMKYKPLPTLYYNDEGEWVPNYASACRFTLSAAQAVVAGFNFLLRYYEEKGLIIVSLDGIIYKDDDDEG